MSLRAAADGRAGKRRGLQKGACFRKAAAEAVFWVGTVLICTAAAPAVVLLFIAEYLASAVDFLLCRIEGPEKKP